MTERRPLTVVSGAVREMPAGDYLPSTITGVGSRNLIINGHMLFNQRGVASTSTDGSYARDRWVALNSPGGTNIQLVADTVAPAGFVRSMKFTVPTARASILSGDYFGMSQRIEGWNFGIAGFGTASAQPVTISFWAYSSVAGSYAVTLRNGAATFRSYVATYTINAANTWEYKTITIPGDTTGTWAVGAAVVGAVVTFTLATGSAQHSPTPNAWATGNYIGHAGQTNFCASTSNVLYITGVQLEVNSFATPFEFRLHSTEELLCRRYFQLARCAGRFWATAGGQLGQAYSPLVPPMCTTPTIANISAGTVGNVSSVSPTATDRDVRWDFTATGVGDTFVLFRIDGASAEI